MTYEERQKAVCQQCHSQRAIECGFVSRGLASKCSYLQNVIYGWELGQQDTIEAIEGACMNGITAKEKYGNVLKRLNELKTED